MTTTAAPQQPATFEAFQAGALAAGFDEVLVREWQPGQVLEEHRHPFAVQAWVVRGEVALTQGGETRVLAAGSRFSIDCDVPHAERYGSEGATFWVARRHGAPGSA